METGSLSLYGLKPVSLDFHPPPTSTSSVSQQDIQLFSPCSTLHTHSEIHKQPADLLMKQGRILRAKWLLELLNASTSIMTVFQIFLTGGKQFNQTYLLYG